MRSSWPGLHAQLLRSTTTLAFHQQFRTMCDGDAALAGLTDPAALFDALHGPIGVPAARNAILTALVKRAQAGAEPAVAVLLLALWPGLDAVHRRLRRYLRDDPQTLASEVCARVVAGIHALDLNRVTRIAATLIRNCERDIIRSLQRLSAEAKRHEPIAEELVSGPRQTSLLGLGDDLDADGAAVRLVALLEPVIGPDAHLVVTIAIEGEHQRVAAAAHGLTAEAGRKRYQRALRRLRVRFEEIC